MGEMTKTSVNTAGNVNMHTSTIRQRSCVDIIYRPD